MREDGLREHAALAVLEQIKAAELKEAGKLLWVADDPDCPDIMRLSALGEEFGEVCRCLHDQQTAGLRTELLQLAGIALAWASVA